MNYGYRISTDSCCDMPVSYYQENQIGLVPLPFTMGTQSYRQMDREDFYQRLREGDRAETEPAGVEEHQRVFEDALRESLDVLHISVSSALSESYHNAVQAAEEMRKKFPGRSVLVVDSGCASMGQGLFLHNAVLHRQAGMGMKENAAWLEENKLTFAHWFTVDELDSLYQGGRVSRAAATVGNMLNLKPVLHVDDQGKLVPVERVRGRRKAIEQLLNHMKETVPDSEEQSVFISHGDCEEEARRLADLIRISMPVKEILIYPVGPVIGSHAGAGTLALFFRAKRR